MWGIDLVPKDTDDGVGNVVFDDDDDVDNNNLLLIVVVIIVVVIICSCGCMHILFCYFCKRKERESQCKGTQLLCYVRTVHVYCYVYTYLYIIFIQVYDKFTVLTIRM